MTTQLDELQLRAWRAFLLTYSKVVPTLDRELSRAQGMRLNQYEVLLWLSRAPDGSLRMSELTARVVLSASGVTRAVDQLERAGFVERCVFEGDRRGQLATITEKGRERLSEASKTHLEGVRRHFLDHLSRVQLENVAGSLESILKEDSEG